MMFGEVSLLFNTKRTASVKSKDRCTVGALDLENFEEMCKLFPDVEKKLKKATTQYNDHWKTL